jgi:FkbM family methyltransferase
MLLMGNLSKNFFSILQPLQFTDEIRLGSKHDGGYVVPRFSVVSSTALISLGYGHDSRFERDFLKVAPKAKCYLFESSIGFKSLIHNFVKAFFEKALKQRAFPLYKLKCIVLYFQTRLTPRMRYFKKEVRSEKSTTEQVTISTVLQKVDTNLNHFIKMDIEGGEYELLASSNLGNPQAMIIEFHSINERYDEFTSRVEDLKLNYLIAHIHLNNFANVYFGVPDVIEVTFVRKDIVPQGITLELKESIPTALDSPCDPRKEDVTIYF